MLMGVSMIEFRRTDYVVLAICDRADNLSISTLEKSHPTASRTTCKFRLSAISMQVYKGMISTWINEERAEPRGLGSVDTGNRESRIPNFGVCVVERHLETECEIDVNGEYLRSIL